MNRGNKEIKNRKYILVGFAVLLLLLVCGGVIYRTYRYIEAKRNQEVLDYYAGKKVTWYGDSLTEMYFFCQGVDNYFGFDGYNSGMNGATITNIGPDSLCLEQRMVDNEEKTIIPDSEIIFVMAGINDWNHNLPVGDYVMAYEAAQQGKFDDTTFAGACNEMIFNLKKNYPNAQIVVLGTPQANGLGYGLFKETNGMKNSYGLTSVEYGDILCEVANLWGIDNINIGRVLDWKEEEIFEYSPDGFHFGLETGSVEASLAIDDYLMHVYWKWKKEGSIYSD